MRSTQFEALHPPASLKRQHPASRSQPIVTNIRHRQYLYFVTGIGPKGGAGITFTAWLSRQVEVERMALHEASIWRPTSSCVLNSSCLAELKIARNDYAIVHNLLQRGGLFHGNPFVHVELMSPTSARPKLSTANCSTGGRLSARPSSRIRPR